LTRSLACCTRCTTLRRATIAAVSAALAIWKSLQLLQFFPSSMIMQSKLHQLSLHTLTKLQGFIAQSYKRWQDQSTKHATSFPILHRGRIANLEASYFFPIIHSVRTWTNWSPGATLLRDFRRPSSKSEALTKSSLISSETLLQNSSLIKLWIEAILHHIYHLSLGKDLVIISAGNCRRGLILNSCCSGSSRMQELLVLFKWARIEGS
jgi:hypothetical protein